MSGNQLHSGFLGQLSSARGQRDGTLARALLLAADDDPSSRSSHSPTGAWAHGCRDCLHADGEE
jgi:hypothetical protein